MDKNKIFRRLAFWTIMFFIGVLATTIGVLIESTLLRGMGFGLMIINGLIIISDVLLSIAFSNWNW